jgi:hypothetical protein
MFISYFSRIFTLEPNKVTKKQTIFWLTLSLTFAFIYGLMLWQKIFSADYIIQDDARQHVFWMQRFIDPELFPNDLIADYFQSLAPIGYSIIYKLGTFLGINPLNFNKILPVIVSLLTTIYCFLFTLKILPLPWVAFLSTLMLNQSLWMRSDIASGTPRGFAYFLFLGFFYYFIEEKFIPTAIFLILQALFYPQCILTSAGLIFWDLISSYFKQNNLKKNYIILLLLSVLMLLLYKFQSSSFSPVISLEEAKNLAEFYPDGRSQFFDPDHPIRFWLDNGRSGMFSRLSQMPWPNALAVLLPFFLYFQHPLPHVNKQNLALFGKLIVVSLVLYFLAHIMLFELHLPSRYTTRTLRIIIDISGAIVVYLLIYASFNYCQKSAQKWVQKFLPLLISFILITPIIFYPSFLNEFPKGSYKIGENQQLYQFFTQQPKDIMIASLAAETDNIPSFSARSVLVSQEYSIPYHNGYYLNQLRPKIIETINAQYSTNLSQLQEFIKRYKIDYWLIQTDSFTIPYVQKSKWLQQFKPEITNAEKTLENQQPALQKITKKCQVFEEQKLLVIDGKCIISQS